MPLQTQNFLETRVGEGNVVLLEHLLRLHLASLVDLVRDEYDPLLPLDRESAFDLAESREQGYNFLLPF